MLQEIQVELQLFLGASNSVKFTGGTGNDSLTLGSSTIATGKNIDMGAGDDTLVIGLQVLLLLQS